MRNLRVIVVLLVGMAGCKDKATPEYEHCRFLADHGDWEGAVNACGAAVAADPGSTSGKSAATLLDEAKKQRERERASAAAVQGMGNSLGGEGVIKAKKKP